MSSFSQVILARTEEYAEALYLAKADYDLSTGSNKAIAYTALLGDSDYSDLAPTNSNVFAYSNPTAGLEEINRFNDWLAANPDYASHLNLAVQVRVDSSSFTDFADTGVIGPNKRRWKGQQVYTFGNGALIGKDQKLIAAFGQIPDDVPYVGDDTLIFFDGIPNTRGTTTPGVTAFGGDVVISGSLQGMNGVITIDDVIQLESGVTNPAAIGVDDNGTIHLRNRGQGFRDLIDQSEIDTQIGQLEQEVKTWVGSQNTSSTRWGMSLIPNSNFSLKEFDQYNGSQEEKPAGVMTIGIDSNEVLMAEDGICSFDGNGKGILLPAIPLEVDATGTVAQRFAVRIRVWGNIDETIENDAESEGLFVAIMETSDDDIGESSHVYDPANPGNPGSLYDTDYDVHDSSVTLRMLNPVTTDAGGNEDGAPIPGPIGSAPAVPEVKSYVYTPTAGTKNVSLAVWARNYNSTVHLDYCILNQLPTLAADVAGLVEQSVQEIDDEDTRSLVEAAGMNDSTAWEVLGSASVVDDPDGGDSHTQASPDAAVVVTCVNPGDGIVSSGIGIQGSTYTVGVRLKLASGQGPVGITVNAHETSTGGNQAISTGYGPHIVSPNPNDIVGIPLIELDASNSETGDGGYTIQVGDDWSTLLGTYEVSGGATISSSPDTSTGLLSLSSDVSAQAFSIAIQADDACDLIVDYVYVVQQSISASIAEAYADAAYAGSEGFVTAINELLIKEQGSILPNASMALYDGLGPSGYSVKGGTMERVTDVNDDVQIQVTGTGAKLLTPSFVLGEADKFSIAVRIRSLVAGVNTCRVSVNWKAGLLQSGETSISTEAGWTRSVGTADNIHEFDIDQDADTNTDISLSGAYPAVGLLMTWDRGSLAPTADIASIMIECDGSFEVDYILVKEQIVSYDLAESTAEGKAAEAYESLVNDLERVNEDLNAETNSLISNAGFMSYVVQGASGSEYQHPKKWVNTYNAGPLVRIVKSTEGGTYTDPFGNNVSATNGETDQDVGQDDACLKLEGALAGTRGVLSEKWQIPPNTSSEFTGDDGSTQTASSTGSYVISAQVRQNQSQAVYVSIIAHESTSFTSPSEKYIFDSSLQGASVSTPVNANHSVYTSGVTGKALEVVNLSSGANYPGDTEPVGLNWVNIGATYTPSADVQHVSFEFRYSTPSAATELYIDYVYLAPQILGTDFAEAFATSLLTTIDAVQQTDLDTLEADLRTDFPGYSDLTDLYADVINESQSLISNGNFEQVVDVGGTDYARNWVSASATDGYKFPIQSQANGSIGTYIATPTGATNTRIISKSIVNPMAKITQSDGRKTAFNFAVRLRGENTPGSATDNTFDFNVRVYAYESSATSNPNSFVTNSAPSTIQEFGLTRVASNDFQQLSLVDLALENPVSQTILTVRQNDQDANEDVADWRVIAGSYVPTNEQVTMVSFHVYIVHDDDRDGTLQTVLIDSITLDVASVSLDLATEIAQDEADDSTRISKNSNPGGNLIDNGRFDIVAGIRGARYPDDWSIKLASSRGITDTLKYPVSSNLTQYKHVKFHASDNDGTHSDYLISRPFRILEDDYKINISVEATTGNEYLTAAIYMLETSTSIINPDSISCIWSASFGTGNLILVDGGTYQANTSSKTLIGSVSLYDGASRNLEYDYEPTEGANWTSIVIKITRATSTDDNVLIRRVSCRPDTASSSRKLADRGILSAGTFGLADFSGKSFSDVGNGFLNNLKSGSRATTTHDFNISPLWNLRSVVGGTFVSDKLRFIYTDAGDTEYARGYISGGTTVNSTDILNFTGQHRCEDFNDNLTNESIGLIVVSTGFYNNLTEKDRPTINSALPIVELADSRNQKSVFGVLSEKEDRDGNPREYSYGAFVTVQDDPEDLDRLIINSLGEGAIWVCNINGNLENGDYITTCEIPGHGMKQDDDLLHNYTVAKITQDCMFELDNPYYDCIEFEFEGTMYRKAFVGCTYHCG